LILLAQLLNRRVQRFDNAVELPGCGLLLLAQYGLHLVLGFIDCFVRVLLRGLFHGF
jgi:hypothetical protein